VLGAKYFAIDPEAILCFGIQLAALRSVPMGSRDLRFEQRSGAFLKQVDLARPDLMARRQF
jgi:hypothetical protein